VPLRRERVELRKQRGLERPRAPTPLEAAGELLGAASIRKAHLLHARAPPELPRLLRVDRDEDARVAAGRQIAEHAAVEAVLGLRDEVKHVVRQPVVVAGRRPDEQIGRPVTTDVHVVAALQLRERDLH
jgi:hypothetical protein